MGTSETYRVFATDWARGASPRYEDWSLGVADDAELVALLDELPAPKRQPNLLFASARLLGVPLRPWHEVRPWLLARWPDVRAEMLARATQTNEPGRCATLLPFLAAVEGPVALIEVGASAGLTLYPDRYSYEYVSPDGVRRIDPADGPSPVVLRCEVPSFDGLPSSLPEVVWRAGIDLNPLDVTDPGDLAWLEALIWPEHEDRADRLRHAAAIAAADPPHVVRDDLNDALAALVSEAPEGATVVVQHSAVLVYLTPEDRAWFVEQVGSLGVTWLSNEDPLVLPDVAARLPEGVDPAGRFLLARDGVPVGLAEPHGRALRLLG
ncbi:DUF2332 domain-containing protein [Antribacter gilvus]|uniref:DUF2332 domain-containing protein n=1 Tax=Antribacter gilvus TaxID=2304675 RepID=UPI000F76D739|nr:DUF2332 domain-containing protein [Antribacter gilvus]